MKSKSSMKLPEEITEFGVLVSRTLFSTIKGGIAQNAIVFRDMYLQCPARNNNG